MDLQEKKTDTGVILNSAAVCPQNWKKSLIFEALNRAKVECSSSELFLNEVDKLGKVFWKNGYSNSFFEKSISMF